MKKYIPQACQSALVQWDAPFHPPLTFSVLSIKTLIPIRRDTYLEHVPQKHCLALSCAVIVLVIEILRHSANLLLHLLMLQIIYGKFWANSWTISNLLSGWEDRAASIATWSCLKCHHILLAANNNLKFIFIIKLRALYLFNTLIV